MKTFALLFCCLAAAVLNTNSYSIDNALITSNQLALSNSLLVNDGTSHSVPLGSIFRFTANTENIQKQCIESSSITLNEMKWKVKLCKEDSHVNVYLLASSAKNASYWASDAEAIIKLLPKVSSIQAVRHKTTKLVFTKARPQYIIKNFVIWETFAKNFVKDNEAVLDVEISVGRISYQKPTDVEQIYSRQHIMLDNVSKLVESKAADVVIRGIKWSIYVAKASTGHLAVRLAADEKQLDMGYYYPVQAVFKLLSFDKNMPPVTYKLSQNYRWGLSQFGNEQFLAWTSFLDKSKQYVSQDKASLLVQIQADEPESMWDINENNLP